jgi:bifunctional non-homologous end joining protein LigD
VDVTQVEVTNPDKVLFPHDDITKGDLVSYYRQVADVMLPHLQDRPLSLQRFPNGVEEQGFFQQEASEQFPDFVRRAAVPRKGGGTVEHPVCDNADTLVYLANLGVVTLHTWTSRVAHLGQPDRMIFDLDPPDDRSVQQVRDVARRVRDLLEEIGLVPFIQTSGSRGFHVVTPLRPSAGFDEVTALAGDAAALLAEREPERLTVERRKAKRVGRLFIDTGRNAWAQTAVASYSVRPKRGAPVATPIEWRDLGRTEPQSYTLSSIPRRLRRKHDPWGSMDQEARPYGPARERLDRLLTAKRSIG